MRSAGTSHHCSLCFFGLLKSGLSSIVASCISGVLSPFEFPEQQGASAAWIPLPLICLFCVKHFGVVAEREEHMFLS